MTNFFPFVSVVVTTYNRKKYLKQTIDSILNQTYDNFELIVVDNFSDYDVHAFIKSFGDNRIMLLQNKNNGMYVINRNLGLIKAQGDYIAFSDDDDWWIPTKLEKCLQCFHKDSTIGIVCSNEFIFINNNFSKNNYSLLQEIYKDQYIDLEKLFIGGNIISGSTVVIHKECFEEVGLYDESLRYLYTEDYHLWLRMSAKFPIFFICEPLGYARFHKENLSADVKKSLIGLYNTLIDTMNSYPNFKTEISKHAQKRINGVTISLIKHFLKELDFANSAKWSFKLRFGR